MFDSQSDLAALVYAPDQDPDREEAFRRPAGLGGEADGLADAVEAWDAAREVVEAAAVGLFVRNVFKGGLRPGEFDDALGEVVDGDFLVAAEIEDLA